MSRSADDFFTSALVLSLDLLHEHGVRPSKADLANLVLLTFESQDGEVTATTTPGPNQGIEEKTQSEKNVLEAKSAENALLILILYAIKHMITGLDQKYVLVLHSEEGSSATEIRFQILKARAATFPAQLGAAGFHLHATLIVSSS